MEELRPGLWTWTAPHPSWTPDADGWEREVRSYAYDEEESLVFFDPLSPPAELPEVASGRPVVVLLTVHWHQRSALNLAVGLGATVYAPAEEIHAVDAPALPYRHGDTLPGGVEAHAGGYPNEATLWIPAHRALVIGDVFLGGEQGFRVQPDSWLPDSVSPDELRGRLRPLLDLPVELLLPTHGDPVDGEASETLRKALAT